MAYTTKIIKIGNSQGIRIPKALLEEMKAKGRVSLRVEDGVLIVDAPDNPRKGWGQAFHKMAEAGEDKLIIPAEIENEWDEENWEW